MIDRICTIATVLLAVSIGPAGAQQVIEPPAAQSFYGPAQVISFADFLFARKDYDRAATEYQRYLYSGATDRLGHARFRVGLCRLNTGNPGGAIEFFRMVALGGNGAGIRDSAAVAWAASALLDGPDADFNGTLVVVRPIARDPTAATRLNVFEALSLLRQSDWDAAGRSITGATPRLPPAIDSSLTRLAYRGTTLPHKSPALGATLSTVVPGLGKVYAGRPTDGLMSFILIGGQAWLSYEGFNKHGAKSFKGWFFGVVGFAFYAGNIYGSKVAVQLYNKRYADGLANEIRTHIGLSTRF